MKLLWIIALFVAVVNCGPMFDRLEGESELVELEQLDEEVGRVRRGARTRPGNFPKTLTFRFRVNNEVMVMHLLKSDINTADPNVYEAENGRFKKKAKSNRKNFALYQDVNTRSSMLVKCKRGRNCRLRGSFRYNGQMYHITPNGLAEKTAMHAVQKKPTTEKSFKADAVMPEESVRQENRRRDGSRPKRAIPTGASIVEILACPDVSVYDYFLAETGTEESAKEAMKQYYSLLINEMDLHYLSLPVLDSTVNVRLYLAGVAIATQASDASWSATQTSVINSVTYLNANGALSKLRSWRFANLASMPNDYAMGFTRYDFEELNPDGSLPDSLGLAGQAYLGVVCTTSAVGITEDDGQRVAYVAAHELGHSLNAYHDGEANSNGAGCSSTTRNVMAPSYSNTVSSEFAEATWKFSSCSVQAFKNYINGLRNNCMTNNQFTETDYDTLRGQPLSGQFYSLDKQCQFALDQQSALSCVTTLAESQCYSGITCRASSSSSCGSQNYYVLAGTSCGAPADNKWCFGGICVPRPVTETTTAAPTTTTAAPTTTTAAPTTTTAAPTTTTAAPTTTTAAPTTTTAAATTTTAAATTAEATTTTTTAAATTTAAPATNAATTTTSATTTTGVTGTSIPETTTAGPSCFRGLCCTRSRRWWWWGRICCRGRVCCYFRWARNSLCCRSCRRSRFG